MREARDRQQAADEAPGDSSQDISAQLESMQESFDRSQVLIEEIRSNWLYTLPPSSSEDVAVVCGEMWDSTLKADDESGGSGPPEITEWLPVSPIGEEVADPVSVPRTEGEVDESVLMISDDWRSIEFPLPSSPSLCSQRYHNESDPSTDEEAKLTRSRARGSADPAPDDSPLDVTSSGSDVRTVGPTVTTDATETRPTADDLFGTSSSDGEPERYEADSSDSPGFEGVSEPPQAPVVGNRIATAEYAAALREAKIWPRQGCHIPPPLLTPPKRKREWDDNSGMADETWRPHSAKLQSVGVCKEELKSVNVLNTMHLPDRQDGWRGRMKIHRTFRRKLQTPKGLKGIKSEDLQPFRTTYIQYEDGSVQTIHDDWKDKKCRKRDLGRRWRGLTVSVSYTHLTLPTKRIV